MERRGIDLVGRRLRLERPIDRHARIAQHRDDVGVARDEREAERTARAEEHRRALAQRAIDRIRIAAEGGAREVGQLGGRRGGGHAAQHIEARGGASGGGGGIPVSRPIRLGATLPQIKRTWSEARDTAIELDRLGFDHLWVCDHVYGVPLPTLPIFEAWTELAAVAAVTQRAALGTLVTPPFFRNPAILAKQ